MIRQKHGANWPAWVLASCMASGYVCAETESELSALDNSQRSTLNNFPLQELEGDDLADAVVAGTLDAPAAGESIEVPDVLKNQKPELIEPYDTREDEGRFNIPVKYNLPPQPVEIGGRTYNYDYLFGTPR